MGTAGQGDSQNRMEQPGVWRWGRMGTEGIPVGRGVARGNDQPRAAWGSQLDPTDLACRAF